MIEAFCEANSLCGATRIGATCWRAPESELSRFPTMKMTFQDVETTWVPRAYLFRQGAADLWCYAFQDDGLGANTVLGTSWMMHQDVIFELPRARVGVAPAKCPEYRDRYHPGDAMTDASSHQWSAGAAKGTPPILKGLRPNELPGPRKPGQPQRFNAGLLWAGLAGGSCIATGLIGVMAAACGSSGRESKRKKSSDRKKKSKTIKKTKISSAVPAQSPVGARIEDNTSESEEDEEEGALLDDIGNEEPPREQSSGSQNFLKVA
eukprot:TRINITY_DN36908_c0_g1_i1.p2 TRINITY_DN36908_c0_g1~~TRINITY_DN36908_c0_g1_i1.p2  ORF type:complete len:264 (+),score=55.63 TRINITY_DN36908_c0_g1_i1:916-1707(+)